MRATTNNVVFRGKNQSLVKSAVAILRDERPMTLRQLFYRCVSAGVIRNEKSEYTRLGSIMTRVREAGTVPRTWLVDHTRSTIKPSSWSGLGDFGESVRACYRKDFWASMPHYVAILVEKDAVAGTIQPVTMEYDTSLHVCRGYSSVSFAGEIADTWSLIDKPIFAYFCGDFDPSGFDLERDLRAKLTRYSGRTEEQDPRFASTDNFVWQRLGVTDEDFDAYDLVRLPVKKTDRRARGFIEQHGDYCAEIDAIPPKELRQRVEDAIVGHIDSDRWKRLVQVEQAEQATLEQFIATWNKKPNLGSVSQSNGTQGGDT